MKKSALVELKNLGIEDILARIKTIRSQLSDLVMDKNMKKLKDLKAVFKKRKDLAQMFTILKQKQLLKVLEDQK